MAEIFSSQTSGMALPLPQNDSLDINSTQLPWQDCGAEGFWIKPLFEDQSSGLRTWLMKVDAGAFSAMHAHHQIEQIYVMQGSFFDQHKTYHAGDYIIRPAGSMHSAGSKDGATVMLIYSPAIDS